MAEKTATRDAATAVAATAATATTATATTTTATGAAAARSAGRRQGTGRGAGNATRQALLDAAVRLFGERGREGASTRAIAAAAGCNIGLIAFHFGGKEGLYRAALDRLKARLHEAADPVVAALRRARTTQVGPERLPALAGEEIARFLGIRLNATADQAFFLLLRRCLAETEETAVELYDEIFLPLFAEVTGILDAAFPERGRENRLRAFLVIDMTICVLRDYPIFHALSADQADAGRDAELLGALVARALLGDGGRS